MSSIHPRSLGATAVALGLALVALAPAPAQGPGFRGQGGQGAGQKGGKGGMKGQLDNGQMGRQGGQGQHNGLVQEEIAYLQTLLQGVQNGATAEQIQGSLQQRITALQNRQQQPGQFGGGQAFGGEAFGQQKGAFGRGQQRPMRGKR